LLHEALTPDLHEFPQQLVNGIALGSLYALIALGYTMVYGVLRLINFAHGDVYMVGAYIGFYAAHWLGLVQPGNEISLVRALEVMPIAMVGCVALGLLIERVAYRPLRRAPRLTALITAIGVSLFLEYGGQLLFGTDPKPFPRLPQESGLGQAVQGVVISKEDVLIVSVAVLLMIALQFIVYRTRAGKAMRAVSYDREAASLMGINVDKVIALTFVIGSAFAGAAGVLAGVKFHQLQPLMGLYAGLKAFVAAVLGGIGSVPGAMVGGLVMGIAEVMVVGYWESSLRDAIVFGILIAILVFRPTGIFGRGRVEKA